MREYIKIRDFRGKQALYDQLFFYFSAS